MNSPCGVGSRVAVTRRTAGVTSAPGAAMRSPPSASVSRYSMRSAMLTRVSPCSRAKSASRGSRAMEPSSSSTSQSTPAGRNPASRARSMAASVCPCRSRTPPSAARSGKMCPGVARSSGRVAGLISTRTVRARSCAEVPVVVPSMASTDTVNGVPMRAVLRRTICGSPSSSSRVPVSATQMMPRPCRAMKFTPCGVHDSAAMMRSPSFSRPSSSTTMTMRPRRISSMASRIELSGLMKPSPSFPRGSRPRSAPGDPPRY